MGHKFTVSVWLREWNHLKHKPEWKYKEVWGGDDFDEALKELEKYRGKHGCVKLESRKTMATRSYMSMAEKRNETSKAGANTRLFIKNN